MYILTKLREEGNVVYSNFHRMLLLQGTIIALGKTQVMSSEVARAVLILQVCGLCAKCSICICYDPLNKGHLSINDNCPSPTTTHYNGTRIPPYKRQFQLPGTGPLLKDSILCMCVCIPMCEMCY